ncbi:DUF429 domain-containing protein [Streptomyces sp. NPDC051963]|uniref:DUF429 domain-containing protein n=1 Tax=Streptomyces sp. NPDC051963 TaxID=3365678 RepID=UPI0037D82F9C
MRTVGIDLSARPPRTAAAVIEWTPGRATVLPPRLACDDEELLKLLLSLGRDDQAGVDCPFGWPATFVASMNAHAAPHPTWPGRDADGIEDLDSLRYRRTDKIVAVHAPRPPLSVSCDKLGAVAIRWARLQALLAARGLSVDRTGRGSVAEVYPSAARSQWGLVAGTVDELLTAAPWLHIPEGARHAYAHSRDAYDALIASLVARAVRTGSTSWPAGADAEAARSEGWIHLPAVGTLARLPDSSNCEIIPQSQ